MRKILLPSVAFACLASSCQNETDGVLNDAEEVVISVDVTQDDWTTVLPVRSGGEPSAADEDEEQTVAYPINYFLFKSDGTFVEKQVVKENESNDTKASFSVRVGDYKVYALCGSDLDAYNDITPSTALSIMPGESVALGSGEFTVSSYSTTEEWTITASHVFSIINLSVSDVPSDVNSMTATISPLYNAVALNGSYSTIDGGVTSQSMSLSNNGNANTWSSVDVCIYKPNDTKATILLNVSYKGSDTNNETLKTTLNQTLDAGTRLNVSANFRKLSTSTDITVSGWTSVEDNVSFETEPNSGKGENEIGEGSTLSTYSFGDKYSYTYKDETYDVMVISQTGNSLLVAYPDIISYSSNKSKQFNGCYPNVTWDYPTESQWSTIINSCTDKQTTLEAVLASIKTSSLKVKNYNTLVFYVYEDHWYTNYNETNGSSESEAYILPVATITLPASTEQ
jgi:hypothetical protein